MRSLRRIVAGEPQSLSEQRSRAAAPSDRAGSGPAGLGECDERADHGVSSDLCRLLPASALDIAESLDLKGPSPPRSAALSPEPCALLRARRTMTEPSTSWRGFRCAGSNGGVRRASRAAVRCGPEHRKRMSRRSRYHAGRYPRPRSLRCSFVADRSARIGARRPYRHARDGGSARAGNPTRDGAPPRGRPQIRKRKYRPCRTHVFALSEGGPRTMRQGRPGSRELGRTFGAPVDAWPATPKPQATRNIVSAQGPLGRNSASSTKTRLRWRKEVLDTT